MNILVAEDDELSSTLLLRILADLGHEAICIPDGRHALAHMKMDPCPVVISDWMMPGMDGISLCRAIRELRTPFYIYFILLTAKIDQSQGAKVLAEGVDAFIPKPLNSRLLETKLNVARSFLETSHFRRVS